MVLVDFIGIFFTCGNTFGHMLYINTYHFFKKCFIIWFRMVIKHISDNYAENKNFSKIGTW